MGFSSSRIRSLTLFQPSHPEGLQNLCEELQNGMSVVRLQHDMRMPKPPDITRQPANGVMIRIHTFLWYGVREYTLGGLALCDQNAHL